MLAAICVGAEGVTCLEKVEILPGCVAPAAAVDAAKIAALSTWSDGVSIDVGEFAPRITGTDVATDTCC
jgi:hypothetical protein